MSSFTAPLAVESIPGTGLWRTLRPLVYYAGEEGSEEVYVVPAGTLTDFGSIPRLAWIIVGPPGDRPAGYVLHDWLYQSAVVSRARADALLREALGVLGYPRWRRWLIWSQVRVWGWVAWNAHRRAGR
jgi:hypothetical protein